MKRKIAAALAAVAMLLSGCQITNFDAQNLMRPPKATGDQAEIQHVLEENSNVDITLKYPQRGEYRSAIVMYDITGDGMEEAVAFYRPNGTDAALHVMIIGKVEGTWKKIQDFTGMGTLVDRVNFGDLNGDGSKELLVGWGNATATVANRLSVYRVGKNEAEEIGSNLAYSELAISDFDNDLRDEILLAVISGADENTEASATVLKLDSETGDLSKRSTVKLDPMVTRYESLITGYLSENVSAVVIDGYRQDGQWCTEVVYWDKGKQSLAAPLSTLESNANPTLRPTSTVSGDIDNDGLVEIPLVTLMPGYNNYSNLDAPCYLTSWNRYNTKDNSWTLASDMVINYAGGYCFQIPDKWKVDGREHITAKIKTDTQTLTFFEWVTEPDGTSAQGVAVLKLQVFSETEWNAGQNTSGFFELRRQSSKVIAASIPDSDSPYRLTNEEIMQNLKLISVT